jgi:galactofuranosylgalactofuranosylrhamnosyl-N-acetylglucosaminyl-diphospho-decaprenol beta-1,5/1,6-galactofuranosyltransferase
MTLADQTGKQTGKSIGKPATKPATPRRTSAAKAVASKGEASKGATDKDGNGVPPTPASPEPAPAAVPQNWDRPGSLLQRVILPNAGDPLDVRALYLDEDKGNFRRVRALSRTQVEFPAQAGISFATYFNAFPASYWRHWTTLQTVELRLVLEGGCRVDVYRSKADGSQMHVSGEVIDAERSDRRVVLSLDLAPFVDGGWYWFEITTDTDVTLHEAGWYAPVEAPGRASVAIGICTFNRPTDCTVALHTIGSDPLLMQSVNAVLVADQGNRKVRDEPKYDEAAALLGDKLRIVDQGNLGGSGGFSRVMYEALKTTDCEQILLLDDDIVIEPDSILRALAFSRFAEHPMIVGGQMLNLTARAHLHSMGEVVDRTNFMWRAAPHVTYDHDFAKYPLRHTTKSLKLHRRIDVDYNGWWMCLIPRVVAEKAGLPLPLFIKWDDAEYGLRAGELGHPTATLPGVAIWHMPWSDKDDAVDWQAYFHLRNRLVVAALHSPHRHGGRMFLHSLKSTLKHLLSLQYSTVVVQQKAMRDFEAGPLALFDNIGTALGDVAGVRSQWDDAKVIASPRELGLPTMSMTKAERFLKPPSNPLTIGRSLIAGLVHNALPAKPEHHERPQLNLANPDARWFMMSRLDGATVATADARGVAYRKRDPKVFRSLLKESLAEHIRIARNFPRLRREYRAAMPELTGSARWEKVFGIGPDAGSNAGK